MLVEPNLWFRGVSFLPRIPGVNRLGLACHKAPVISRKVVSCFEIAENRCLNVLPVGLAMYSVQSMGRLNRFSDSTSFFNSANNRVELWKLITSDCSSMKRLIGESLSETDKSPDQTPAVSG